MKASGAILGNGQGHSHVSVPFEVVRPLCLGRTCGRYRKRPSSCAAPPPSVTRRIANVRKSVVECRIGPLTYRRLTVWNCRSSPIPTPLGVRRLATQQASGQSTLPACIARQTARHANLSNIDGTSCTDIISTANLLGNSLKRGSRRQAKRQRPAPFKNNLQVSSRHRDAT